MLSFREKLQWLEDAETLTLRMRASRAAPGSASMIAEPDGPATNPRAGANREEES